MERKTNPKQQDPSVEIDSVHLKYKSSDTMEKHFMVACPVFRLDPNNTSGSGRFRGFEDRKLNRLQIRRIALMISDSK
jgi:hypothetical protein